MIPKILEKKYYIITFCISMLYRMIQIAGEYEMRLVQDDIGMLSGAAYLAGYDWSCVTATTKYYGIGYHILFAPLFRFLDNPELIWLTVIYANATLISLTCVFIYHMGIKYLNMQAGIVTAIISVISSFVIISSRSMSQEPALFFLTWLIAYLLIKWCATEKKLVISILMLATILYSYLIHSRAVVFWIGIFGIFVILAIKGRYSKKYIKKMIFLLLTTVIVYIAAGFIRDIIIQAIWGSSEQILNSEIPIDSSIFSLFSVKGLIVCFDMCISNIATTSIRVFGINIMALTLFLFCIFINWKGMEDKCEIAYQKIVILTFSFICFLLGIIGVSVIWGEGVVSSYFTKEVSYSYKGFSYYRYYATFLGPSVFVTLYECLTNSMLRKIIKMPALCLQAGIYIYFLIVISKNMANSEYVNSARLEYLKFNEMDFDMVNYRLSILFSFGILAFLFLMYSYRAKVIFVWSCLVIATIPYIRNIEDGLLTKPQLSSLADGGYKLIIELEQHDYVPDKIYCNSTTRSYRYQFQLIKYPIIIGYPIGNESAVVFTGDNNLNDSLDESFECIQIDENEYVWTNDRVIYEITEKWLEDISIH